MGYLRFLTNSVTVFSREEKGLNSKNDYGCSKLANFWPDNISKINCRILLVISYILSKFRLKEA